MHSRGTLEDETEAALRVSEQRRRECRLLVSFVPLIISSIVIGYLKRIPDHIMFLLYLASYEQTTRNGLAQV